MSYQRGVIEYIGLLLLSLEFCSKEPKVIVFKFLRNCEFRRLFTFSQRPPVRKQILLIRLFFPSALSDSRATQPSPNTCHVFAQSMKRTPAKCCFLLAWL